MHYPFRDIYLLYARASAQNHRVFSFLRNVHYVTSNVRFISQYTLFVRGNIALFKKGFFGCPT